MFGVFEKFKDEEGKIESFVEFFSVSEVDRFLDEERFVIFVFGVLYYIFFFWVVEISLCKGKFVCLLR